jgi:hypothetical protein
MEHMDKHDLPNCIWKHITCVDMSKNILVRNITKHVSKVQSVRNILAYENIKILKIIKSFILTYDLDSQGYDKRLPAM